MLTKALVVAEATEVLGDLAVVVSEDLPGPCAVGGRFVCAHCLDAISKSCQCVNSHAPKTQGRNLIVGETLCR